MTAVSPLATAEPPVHRYSADHYVTMAEEWRDVVQHGHLLYNLVYRDLTVRYKRSVIGFFWTMLNPLLLMMIFVIVFSALFRFSLPHYETYFLSEYLPWMFFSQTTLVSMQSMNWNGALMKRVRVPKSIFALASTLSGLVNLILSYVPLMLIMAIRGVPIRPAIAFLPVSFAILALFTFGFSLALSSVSVFFVDVREMYAIVLTAIMYLTPMIYPITIVPERYRGIFQANPLVYLLQIVRDPIYSGTLPDGRNLIVSAAAALIAFVIGWAIFRRLSRNFYPHL